ncbi:MAG: FMN-binding protein [Phycisphaerae bacterium]|nr:FMN-binding protein [Phycisphaerae bacterium]
MLNMLKQIWLVLVLSLIFGAALAYTDQSTKQRIAENRQQQIRELAQMATVGELVRDEKGQAQFKIELKKLELSDKTLVAYEVLPIGGKGPRVGYAVIGEGIGWDRLLVLIGLSPDLSKITGLEILESRETPGLGERIKGDEFRAQYRKSAQKPLELVKSTPTEDHQVMALTGATISSEAVTAMVNTAVGKVRKAIQSNNKN